MAQETGEDSLTTILANSWSVRGGIKTRLDQLRDWRNAYHGHGALGDHRMAARQVRSNLPVLADTIDLLTPFLNGARLACEDLLDDEGRAHKDQEMLPLAATGAAGVSLRPLVEMLEVGQGPRALWFLEAGDPFKPRLQLRRGAAGGSRWFRRADLAGAELDAVERLAEPWKARGRPLEEEQGGLELGWLTHMKRLRFAGFDKGGYTEPTYLVEQVETALDAGVQGALRITGPAGCGKSFLARGLVERWRDGRPWLILPYFAVPGRGAEAAAFIAAIHGAVLEEARRLEPSGVYLSLPDEEARPPRVDAFADWLCNLAEVNPSCERLVLVLDGLDEIRPKEQQAVITSLLPRSLPEGLFLLLVGRSDDELHPDVLGDLAGLEPVGASPVTVVTDPSVTASNHNRAVLHRHLERIHGMKSRDRRGAVIRAAEGRFLYVETLARGLAEGAFTIESDLPGPGQIMQKYLGWLVGRMDRIPAYGRAMEQTVALLGAARVPVPVECLVDWGIEDRFVEEILIDLGGLLAREHQDPDELVQGILEPYRYRIYHRELTERLDASPEWRKRIAQAHRTILECLVEDRAGLWDDEEAVSWNRPEDAYALLNVAAHAQVCGTTAAAQAGLDRTQLTLAGYRTYVHVQHLVETSLDLTRARECLDAAAAAGEGGGRMARRTSAS